MTGLFTKRVPNRKGTLGGILIASTILASACGQPKSPQPGETFEGQGFLGLGPGWSLFYGDEKDLFTLVPSPRWTAWEIDHTLDESQTRPRYRRSTTILEGRAYWVYVWPQETPESATDVFPPVPTALSKRGGSESSGAAEFVRVTQQTPAAFFAPAKIYTWDHANQRPARISNGASLQAGQIYWLERENEAGQGDTLVPHKNDQPTQGTERQRPDPLVGGPPEKEAAPRVGAGGEETSPTTGLPPVLLVVRPLSEVITTQTASVTLDGAVYDDDLAMLTINGVVKNRQDGKFSHGVWLSPGANTFLVRATDRAGHTTTTVRRIRYEPPLGPDLAPSPPGAPRITTQPEDLVILVPHERVHHTQHDTITLEGRLSSEKSSDTVWINGVLTNGVTDRFSAAIHLEAGPNSISVMLRNHLGLIAEVMRTVVRDEQPPQLIVHHPPKAVVYQKSINIRGFASDPHLDRIEYHRDPHQDPKVNTAIAGKEGRFEVQDTLAPGPNRISLRAYDRAGNVQAHDLSIHFETEPYEARFKALPPSNLVGWADSTEAHIRWNAPTHLSNGQPIPLGVQPRYRIYRVEERAQAEKSAPEPWSMVLQAAQYDGPLPQEASGYTFFVRALLPGPEGQDLESEPSSQISLSRGQAAPITASGTFETPAKIPGVPKNAEQPVLAISERPTDGRGASGGPARTHLAYIAKNPLTHGDQIHYAQNDRFAKADAWSPPRALNRARHGTRIIEVAIAAQGDHVLVAWLQETHRGPEGVVFELFVAESDNGGEGFSATPKRVRSNRSWKRSIDVAIDRLDHSHLVWGEAHRAYYVKNLGTTVENVFDETKRDINNKTVGYQRIYTDPKCAHAASPTDLAGRPDGVQPSTQAKTPPDPCACTVTVREHYALAREPNPNNNNQPYGVYLFRTEEAHIVNPSLHVDRDKITIVAHQIRSFDNLPVENPKWARRPGRFTPPKNVPSPGSLEHGKGCLPEGSIAKEEGFGRTWKKDAYTEAPTSTPSETTDLDGYQYLYSGTWDENDRIKVAQRPLVPGQWSQEDTAVVPMPQVVENFVQNVATKMTIEAGWKQGTWINDRLQRWRIRTVDTFEGHGPRESTADGENKAPRTARPQAHTTHDGRLFVIYEKWTSIDEPTPPGPPVYVSTSTDGGTRWTAPTEAVRGYHPDLIATSTDEIAAVFYAATDAGIRSRLQFQRLNEPTAETILVRQEASSLHESHPPMPHGLKNAPHIAGYQDLVVVAWAEPSSENPSIQRVMTSRMTTAKTRTAQLTWTAHKETTVRKMAASRIECLDQYAMHTHDCEPRKKPSKSGGNISGQGDGAQTVPQSEPRTGGDPQPTSVHTVWTTPFAARQPGAALLDMLDIDATSLELATASTPGQADQRSLAGTSAYTNVLKAKRLRDELYNPDLGAQREYLADTQDRDADHLAAYDRVWAYTQGIALAQFARQRDPRATPLAQYLCAQATWGTDKSGTKIILGWPFSWNTHEDSWADARLVTGANAWVVQGLGHFITSSAFDHLEDLDVVAGFKMASCYKAALRGLLAHRKDELMTAGHSTEGLEHAKTPYLLGLEDDPEVTWAYYDILDAIGYPDFDEEKTTTIARFRAGAGGRSVPAGQHTLTKQGFERLKTPMPAENVVTEHNLDQLSVLNHAIKHRVALRGNQVPLETELAFEEEIVSWRNGLRKAIFDKLWDAQDKRFITGGAFEDDAFIPNRETAIDNCSWLSLSVDYPTLEVEQKEKLADCLDYTIKHFVKVLDFNHQRYRGSHYFPNSFSDPYIEKSDVQEELYHLEATTGLILGLRRFVDHNAHHARSAAFLEEADLLWAEMQRFVGDHGFPYSSHRIQDLMTRLESSTAAIWFIDVYDDYATQEEALDRPLRNYARGIDLNQAQKRIEDAKSALEKRAPTNYGGRLEVFLEDRGEDGRHEAAWGRYTSPEVQEKYRVRLIVTEAGEERLATTTIHAVEGAGHPPFTEIHDVPVNITAISVKAHAEEREPSDWRQHVNGWGWFTEVHYVFEGTVDVSKPLGKSQLMLSALDDNTEKEWFITVLDFDQVTGAFSFSYKAGTEGLPDFALGDWAGYALEQPETRQNNDGTESLMIFKGTGAELKAMPIVRLIAQDPARVVAATMAPMRLQLSKYLYAHHDYEGTRPNEETAGQWSFHHRFGGQHRYEVVEYSDGVPRVVDALSESDIKSALVASTTDQSPHPSSAFQTEDTPTGSPAVTLIEDQALLILAELRRPGTQETATVPPKTAIDDYAKGLWATLEELQNDGQTHFLFPYAVYTQTGEAVGQYYQTDDQFLALYALAQHNHHESSSQRIERRKKLVQIGRSLCNLFRVGEENLRLHSGIGNPGQVGKVLERAFTQNTEKHVAAGRAEDRIPRLTRMYLRDYVYAFFAALELIDDAREEDDRALFYAFRNGVEEAVRERFWDATGAGQPIPYIDVHEDGTLVPGADPGMDLEAAALYTLFALQDDDHLSRAQRASELLSQLWDPATNEATPSGEHEFSRTAFFSLLALRSAAIMDPRLEELAWVTFSELGRQEAESIGALTALQIAQDPGGLFGVRSGPLFFAKGTADMPLPIAQERLKRYYYETLAALLMADEQAYIFDALLHRLVLIRFAYAKFNAVEPPLRWPSLFAQSEYEALLGETIYSIDQLCEGAPFLRDPDVTPWLGLSCDQAAAGFASRLKARLGARSIAHLAMEIDRQDDPFLLLSLAKMIDRYTHEATASAIYGNLEPLDQVIPRRGAQTQTSYHYLARLQTQEGPLVTETEAQKFALRALWARAIASAGRLQRRHFRTPDIDLGATANPGSPDYWSRPAIEYRVLQEHDLFFRMYAHEREISGSPEPILLGPREVNIERGHQHNNVQAFRRWLNQYQSGDVMALAQVSGLSPFELHAMTRTGKLTASQFQRMAAAIDLSPEEIEASQALFVFIPEDNLARPTNMGSKPRPSTFTEHLAMWSAGDFILPVPGTSAAKSANPDNRAPATSSTEKTSGLARDGLHTPSGAPLVRVPAHWPSAMFIAHPELVQYNGLILLEAAAAGAGREALKTILIGLAGLAVQAGLSASVDEAEINATVELLVGHAQPNVLVVEAQANFNPPPAPFEYIGSVPALPSDRPEAIYAWIPGVLAELGAPLEDRLAQNLLDNLAFSASDAVKNAYKEELRLWWNEKASQDIILRKTDRGVDVYRTIRWFEDFRFESPKGTVMWLDANPQPPRVVYTHPVGLWHHWYRDQVADPEIPSDLQDAHTRWVDQWLFDTLTRKPSAQDWAATRRDIIKRYIQQGAPLSPPPDSEDDNTPTTKSKDPLGLPVTGMASFDDFATGEATRQQYRALQERAAALKKKLGGQRVPRIWQAKKLGQTEPYPTGVYEANLEAVIQHANPVYFENAAIEDVVLAMEKLVEQGINLDHPIAMPFSPQLGDDGSDDEMSRALQDIQKGVGIDPEFELSIARDRTEIPQPKRQDSIVLAMSLLGEKTIPIRYQLDIAGDWEPVDTFYQWPYFEVDSKKEASERYEGMFQEFLDGILEPVRYQIYHAATNQWVPVAHRQDGDPLAPLKHELGDDIVAASDDVEVYASHNFSRAVQGATWVLSTNRSLYYGDDFAFYQNEISKIGLLSPEGMERLGHDKRTHANIDPKKILRHLPIENSDPDTKEGVFETPLLIEKARVLLARGHEFIQVPIKVTPVGGLYEIRSGEDTLAILELAGAKTVPVQVVTGPPNIYAGVIPTWVHGVDMVDLSSLRWVGEPSTRSEIEKEKVHLRQIGLRPEPIHVVRRTNGDLFALDHLARVLAMEDLGQKEILAFIADENKLNWAQKAHLELVLLSQDESHGMKVLKEMALAIDEAGIRGMARLEFKRVFRNAPPAEGHDTHLFEVAKRYGIQPDELTKLLKSTHDEELKHLAKTLVDVHESFFLRLELVGPKTVALGQKIAQARRETITDYAFGWYANE